MLAGTAKDYQLAMMDAIARLHDSHANLWSSLTCAPRGPVRGRDRGAVRRQASGRYDGRSGSEARAGDVITSIDGASIDSLRAVDALLRGLERGLALRDVAASLMRCPCGDVPIAIDRRGSPAAHPPRATPAALKPIRHDLAGPTFRLLSPTRVSKLSGQAHEIAHEVEQAAGTKGWIVDIGTTRPISSCSGLARCWSTSRRRSLG